MRVYFKGEGQPNPELVFPDPGMGGDSVTLILNLTDGVPFLPQTYIDLGYTHYEVWCVGGSGGRGGHLFSGYQFYAQRVLTAMDSTMWAINLRIASFWASRLDPPYGPYSPPNEAGLYAYVQANNPGHTAYVATFLGAYLSEMSNAGGGGGGGGGSHRHSGLLLTLPDEVEVVVGQAGIDSGVGQTDVNGVVTPIPEAMQDIWDSGNAQYELDSDAMREWQNSYPEPRDSFAPPQPGGDGGYSSFNGDMCQASGGKGGKPVKSWVSGSLVVDGAGGEGGIGNRATPGGGAAGSTADNINGQQGTWNGTIGSGGGGGRGGHMLPRIGHEGMPDYTPPRPLAGTDGGRGAYSFEDTTLYGARQPAVPFPVRNQTYDYYTGELDTDTTTMTSVAFTGGGGGGARPYGQVPYGGRAVGSNPEGVVLIRIFRIE
jgi:hypothetical protein